MNINRLQNEVLEAFRLMGLNNTLSISKELGMVQSTVYRNLEKPQKRITPSLKELCIYAGIDISRFDVVEPESNQTIMDALKQVWDGSEDHAREIKRLLLAAHSCKIRT